MLRPQCPKALLLFTQSGVGIFEGKELFCVTYVIQNVRPVGSSPDVRLSMSVDRRVGSVKLQRKGFLLQQTIK